MEKCKYCQGELEENNTVCPVCGKDNALAEDGAENTPEKAPENENPQIAQAKNPEIVQGSPWRVAVVAAAVVLLAAVLIGTVLAGRSTTAEEQVPATESTQTQVPATEPTQTQVLAEETAATIPADGNPDDVTCKGSYSASDEEVTAARDTVVATIGERGLCISQLQVYYEIEYQSFLNNYGMYAAYFGLDYTQPLDTQVSMDESGITWQQLFLQNGLKNWQQIQAMAAEAEHMGLEMSQENKQSLAELDATLEALAQSYGITVEELMYSNFGPGVDVADYRYFQEQYSKGVAYYDAVIAGLAPTEEELEAFFREHQAEYESGGVTEDDRFVDVRHILVTVKSDGSDEPTEEEWESCRQDAQKLLDEWLTGDGDEAGFAAMAEAYTEDPGSMQTGGLYEKIYEGQMVSEFNDWCFDESRTYGDYGLVRTSYGYHVMFFVGSQPQWKVYAENDWIQEQSNQILEDLVERYPMDVDYSKILLGTVNFLSE